MTYIITNTVAGQLYSEWSPCSPAGYKTLRGAKAVATKLNKMFKQSPRLNPSVGGLAPKWVAMSRKEYNQTVVDKQVN